jgi:RNA polymerase sigma factor for flagellar operon FliA
MIQATRVPASRRPRLTKEKRDQIVLDHLPLVKAIAIRVHENLPVHVDLDDLIHAGVLGLFDAVLKYDNSKNVAFHAYAKHRIKGAILDNLREMDWASRDLRRRQKQLDTVTRDLTGKLGRTPQETEVAGEMGIDMTQWRRVQMELRTVSLISATPNVDAEGDRPMEFVGTPESRPDRMCERQELHTTLARVIGKLPERYQKVVFLYYTNDLTMKEIGDMLGVNESRISQIHKIALKKMATVLEGEGINSAASL